MEKREELMARISKINEMADNTVPAHAPEIAPELAAELVSVRLEMVSNFINDKEIQVLYTEARSKVEDLVEFYSSGFAKIKYVK